MTHQDKKFDVAAITKLIQGTSHPYLSGKAYDKDEAGQWMNELGQKVTQALKESGHPQFKYIVTVDLGENKGEGTR
ncbi:hypothetical protein IWQ60_009807 [Tieghemiomyces parasiticus]|uniref:Topoisomerase I damage affected protein 2 n=1 Tax=Tieghemiomyces parasiticus TaxID=78921 RepID=A0A9W8DNX9_9FUNG|nr:hypothetical protein IWQ60_009807 [Tieghemiomyces parasiticus]